MKEFNPPIPNLYEYIAGLAQAQPEKRMLSQHDRSGRLEREVTCAEFKELIDKVGAWFVAKGLKSGDRVAMYFGNSIELLTVSWAAWSLGIVSVPLDTKRDMPDDMKYKTSLTEAKLVLSMTELPEEMKNLIEGESVVFSFEAIDAFLKEKNTQGVPWKKGLDHEALILFTSGTTGRPKGASLSLQNLIANGDGIREWFNITEEDTFMVILPLHHINSTSFCFASLLGGASIAIPPRYSASKFWAQVAGTGATFTSIVPTICYDQLTQITEFAKYHDDIKMTKIQIGSAPVKPSDVKKFLDLYSIKLYQGYGQTETALRVAGQPHDVSDTLYQELVETNSIGVPMKWAELAILDENDNELGEGEEGQLAVRGPIVMKGYLGGEKAFNKDGWFMTGDLAYFKKIDGRTFYFLKGRLKEIIIKGGVNVSPAAVEDKVKQIDPNIDKICVIGVSDDRYGEEIAAGIVWKQNTGLSDLQKETELKHRLSFDRSDISTFEIPEYIFTLREEDIPMTSTRKVQRSVLAKQIDPSQLQPILQVSKNDEYQFMLLRTYNKPHMKQAFEIYNTCWAPLTLEFAEFQEHVANGTVIVAVKDNKVAGFVSLLKTDLSENNLSQMTYSQVTGGLTMNTAKLTGDKAVCIAIGSSNYEPKEEHMKKMPEMTPPTEDEVKAYLEEGLDYVYKFHQRAKGGLKQGAELLKIMPNARPEDKIALGYNMLMKYPALPENIITPDPSRSIGAQLIEAAMSYAQQCGIKDVYAFSRPAGLREYVTNK